MESTSHEQPAAIAPAYDANDPATFLRAASAALDQPAAQNAPAPLGADIRQARAWIALALSLMAGKKEPEPEKLTSFAEFVLNLMEREEEWSSDTMDAISEQAHAQGLARSTPSGHFKRTKPKKARAPLALTRDELAVIVTRQKLEADLRARR